MHDVPLVGRGASKAMVLPSLTQHLATKTQLSAFDVALLCLVLFNFVSGWRVALPPCWLHWGQARLKLECM